MTRDRLHVYEQLAGYRFDSEDVRIAVAAVAGFFAARAGRPEVPGFPRLRQVQKLQLFPSLRWLADVTEVDSPPPERAF